MSLEDNLTGNGREPIRIRQNMDDFRPEKIGSVTLDYSRYPGQDLYCDGAVEDELLSIVKNLSPIEYGKAIEERKSWPILYHLSEQRENIVDWLPMDASMKVLEVGSGCGAITGALARKAGRVDCVDLSKKRSLINAYRHSDCENVTIHVGNFKDIEPELPNDYDYICLIGVFEYGQSYIGGATPYEDFLRILQPHLKENGRIVIAIENKYGMKYFAGCKEDHLGTWFSGIENYAAGGGVRTFGRNGLQRIFAACGAEETHFYYPYPDYKFMTTLYSDNRLPGKGELTNNLRNFDRDRMLLFDEKHAFDGIVEEGMFPFFSNSYLVVLGPEIETDYVKYSNDRAPEYQIKTVIGHTPQGQRYVRKLPCSEAAVPHVLGMGTACESLRERYAGSGLSVNSCTVSESETVYAEFEYVQGTPLSELLDACLDRKDTEGFGRLFEQYLEKVGYHSDYPVSDYDLIFANLLVDGENWTLIDYEWTFGRAMDVKESAFRAIYCYLLEDEKRNALDLDGILNKLEITQAEAEDYREQERQFQSFVTGNRLAMGQIRDLIGFKVIRPGKWMEQYQDDEAINRVQVYEDLGKGFSEETSYFVQDAFQNDREIELKLTVSGDVQTLRIDPAFASCVVHLEEVLFNGEPVNTDSRKILKINGRIAKPATLIFPTEDPNIYLYLSSLNRRAENSLYMRMKIARVPVEMTGEMADAVKKLL